MLDIENLITVQSFQFPACNKSKTLNIYSTLNGLFNRHCNRVVLFIFIMNQFLVREKMGHIFNIDGHRFLLGVFVSVAPITTGTEKKKRLNMRILMILNALPLLNKYFVFISCVTDEFPMGQSALGAIFSKALSVYSQFVMPCYAY